MQWNTVFLQSILINLFYCFQSNNKMYEKHKFNIKLMHIIVNIKASN